MDPNEAFLFHVDGNPPINGPGGILSQALLNIPHLKAVRFVFSRGEELSEHTATVPALIHQVSGRSRWTFGSTEHQASPGDWVHLPPNLKHSLLALEDSVVLLFLLKAPGANS